VRLLLQTQAPVHQKQQRLYLLTVQQLYYHLELQLQLLLMMQQQLLVVPPKQLNQLQVE
jgi:hypothetical protein